MELLLEIRKDEQTRDWETLKSCKYNLKNVRSYKKQAKKLIKDGVYQVHVCGWKDENDDPSFQEFYYADGTTTKMF